MRFKVGVIGCGAISRIYASVFHLMPDTIEVCFAVDPKLSRAQAFAAQFPGCGAGDRIEALLSQPLDVVHVLTPHYLHAGQTIACLEQGFHVLVEKPMATRMEDARAMIEAADRTGRQLGVIFQNRYIEGVQELKRLVEAGALGRLTGASSYLAWHRTPAYYSESGWRGTWAKEGGGVSINQAIHSLDLVRYLMGSPVSQVEASIATRVLRDIEVEDVAEAAVTFENGAVYAYYATNYNADNSPIRVELFGERGSALLVESQVTISLSGEEPYTVHPKVVETLAGQHYWGRYHLVQVRDFYDCLAAKRPVPVDPRDAIQTLELVLSIYQSAREKS